MGERRKLTMEDLRSGNLVGITLDDVRYNGFLGEAEYTEPKPGQIKVACVGDSITYGHGIYNWPEENYPKVLSKLLGEKYHVQSFGACGRCVQDAADQPYREEDRYRRSLAYGADILVFMMGTNDSKPENWHGEAAFRAAVQQLLGDYLRGVKKPKVFLCTPATAFFAEGFTGNITLGEGIKRFMSIPENKQINHIFTRHSDKMIEQIKALPEGQSLYGNYSDAWKKSPWDKPSCTVKENHGGVAEGSQE